MRMPASTAASPSSSSSSSSSSTAAAVTITIKNFGYTVSGPATVGAVVQVTNNDIEAHTVTADSGHAFAVTIQAGKTATFKAPTAAGSFTFHCDFHSNMHGTLTVSK
jgi:plastocyanin